MEQRLTLIRFQVKKIIAGRCLLDRKKSNLSIAYMIYCDASLLERPS